MSTSITLRSVLIVLTTWIIGDAVAAPASSGTGTGIGTLAGVADKAIAPTCYTSLIPVSSTCNGVQATSAAGQQAVQPLCNTFYSTSTSCAAGVHPQPTFEGAPVTVTKLIYQSNPSAPLITTTVTTSASLSVTAASASGSEAGDYTFFLTPSLQQDIVALAETFCAPVKYKRQTPSAPSCALNPGLENAFVNGVASLIDADVITAGTQLAAGVAPFVIAVSIFKLFSSSSVQPLALSLDIGAGQIASLVSSASSSSSKPAPAPTLYPGPPNCNYTSLASSNIFALRSYWASVRGIQSTYSSPCHFGTLGTQSYCMCTDGFYHSISVVTTTATVNGSQTQTVDYCPYTSIPSATIAAGLTVESPMPLLTTTQPPSVTAPPMKSLALSAATCFFGSRAFRDSDMSSAVSAFCSDASESAWSFPPASPLTTNGLFSNGVAVSMFTSIFAGPTVGASQTTSAPTSILALQVWFTNAACAPGQDHSLDMTNSKMCERNFLSIENDCDTAKPSGGTYWKHGGMMYADCVEWSLHAVEA